MVRDESARNRILECSRQEFLQNGFKNASLRNIAAEAGLTTGAIYGYFKNKNAVFEELVRPVCEQLDSLFNTISKDYYDENGNALDLNAQKSVEELRRVYGFIYTNLDAFRLLLCCAEGSSYADFVHTIVEHEVRHSLAYIEQVKKHKNVAFEIDTTTLHIIADSFVNALVEPVRHDLDLATALKNIELLGRFYTAGWEHILEHLTGGKSADECP